MNPNTQADFRIYGSILIIVACGLAAYFTLATLFGTQIGVVAGFFTAGFLALLAGWPTDSEGGTGGENQ